MLKLGVCRANQYAHVRGGPLEWFRRDHVDYRLLRPAGPPSSGDVRLFESVTRHLQMRRGVYRTTSQARFRGLDSWLTRLLARYFDSAAAFDVQDWAASDCMASLAWHDDLIATFPRLRLVASDVALHLIEMQAAEGSYVFEAGADVLQFVSPPFVIRLNPAESPFLIVNRLLARLALARLARLRRGLAVEPAAVEFPDGVEEVQHGPLTFRKIPLVHPHVVAARARATKSFRVEYHSVFQRANKPAHVIRTMNILNPGYCTAAMIERAGHSVFDTLFPGGLWVLGRTMQDDPPLHHVSVLVKTDTGFRLLERFNQKSEVEDLALVVRA